MGELLYYLEDYVDETMPCAPSLEGWAEWLAKPADHEDVEGWGRGEVFDGQVFAASVMERLPNMEATWDGEAWTHPPTPAGATFFAEAYNGGGWSGESACDDLQTMLDSAVEWQSVSRGDTLEIAVCADRPSVRIEFRVAPTPTCTVVAVVQ